MITLGKTQELIVKKKMDFGVYLYDGENEDERVLLPIKQVPEKICPGDMVRVFIYRDSEDRLIATTRTPLISLGEVAKLRVKETARIGAFLDWGLEKDLLLPFAGQTKRVKKDEEVLVALYADKSDRLCATMNVYPYLSQSSPYQKDDKVSGTVYELSDNFGAFVAVDDKYSGLIPKKELSRKPEIGEEINARVSSVKEDGKLNLTIREKVQVQMSLDSDCLVKLMQENHNRIPFTDKATPEVIAEFTGMSKNQFKRAVGHLLKLRKISIGENDIRLL